MMAGMSRLFRRSLLCFWLPWLFRRSQFYCCCSEMRLPVGLSRLRCSKFSSACFVSPRSICKLRSLVFALRGISANLFSSTFWEPSNAKSK